MTETVEEKLERIESLLAFNLIEDMEELEAVFLLHMVGYSSTEIGEYLNMSSSTVRNRIQKLREEGRIDD